MIRVMHPKFVVRREALLSLGLLIFCAACAPSVTIRRLAPAPYNLGPVKKLVLAAANGPSERETGLVRVRFIEQIDDQGFFDIEDAVPAREDLFDFFEMRPTIRSLPAAIPAPRPIRDGVEFQDVSFAYPGSDHLVVRNINFRLHPSEKVALIGENGAGKTTLVKLLARLYDPTEGRILLDGVDLREYDVDQLRQEIGVIFQDYMRYDMFVRDNIGFGRIESLDDLPRIETAARKLGMVPPAAGQIHVIESGNGESAIPVMAKANSSGIMVVSIQQ